MIRFAFIFRHFFRLVFVLYAVHKAYKTIPTYSISKQYRETQAPSNPDFIYGELSVLDFLYLLNFVPKKTNCTIYDLGSGDGKLLLAAALFFKHIHAVGIEKIEALEKVASAGALSFLGQIQKNHSTLTFVAENFLEHDFSDAHLIFTNSAALKQHTWSELVTLLEKSQKETFVISVARKVESPLFSLIYTHRHNCSWGKAWVYIYQKLPDQAI